jgi:hypothetical protein
MTSASGDTWMTGAAYEAYMGRWSRPLARVFVEWLHPKPSAHWLEVGCGTGALTSTNLQSLRAGIGHRLRHVSLGYSLA